MMKRKSFCAFGLIFWLIAFSTIFSFAVQRWMTPIVISANLGMSGYIPLDCIQLEENGPHLYSIFEGDNWSTGTRATEVPADAYSVADEKIYPSYTAGNVFVHYATKPILSGGPVTTKYHSDGPGPDVWLIFPLDGTDPVLHPVESAARPFMAGRVKGELEAEKLYSLYDVRELFSAFIPLAAVPAGVLFCLVLWGAICIFAKDTRNNRGKLFLNVGILLAFLIALPFYLSAINLPSSLLPRANLLDFSHYRAEFTEIFTALEGFAQRGDSTSQELLRHASSMRWAAGGVVLVGPLLGGCVVLLELLPKRKPSLTRGGTNRYVPRHAAPREPGRPHRSRR